MKTVYITTMMISVLFMLILPLSAKNSLKKLPASALPQQNTEQVYKETEEVKVKLSATNEVVTMPLSDYLFGVVAAEMPALYEVEALKAQTVAAYTYFLVQKEGNADKGYDITDDYTVDQAFILAEKAREKWGGGAKNYESKIRSAVEAVLGKRVLYGGKPARTVYHAVSFGVTENATDVWGGEYPYLVSVDSSFDKLEKNFLSEKTVTAEELKAALSSLAEVKDLSTNCITDITRTAAGGVKKLKISGKEITGAELRQALELKSANFEVEFKEGKYTFSVKGYGHAVGMSQNGANYLALQGKTYEEILLHYYTGCSIG